MTHTPGPWENTPNSGEIADANGFYVARVIHAVTPWGKANARLIAAAPDLLAAVEAFLAYNDKDGDDVRMMLDYGEALRLARAAIAKAKGEA